MKEKIVNIIGCILILLSGLLAQQNCGFSIARLKYGGGGDWYANPSSLPNLITAVHRAIPVDLCDTVAIIEIMDEDFFRYPFIYMTGHGNVRFTQAEQLRLRAYLTAGGFLWADDNYGMDKSFRREMKKIFPENPLTLVPLSHRIYTAYKALKALPKIHEHDGEPAQGLGIFFDNRLVVFYTYSSDIGDGMENLEVHNDGPAAHQAALKMGVNILAWFFEP